VATRLVRRSGSGVVVSIAVRRSASCRGITLGPLKVGQRMFPADSAAYLEVRLEGSIKCRLRGLSATGVRRAPLPDIPVTPRRCAELSPSDDTNGNLDAFRDSLCWSRMPPARCVFGIAWDFVAEAEPITVRNRHPGGNSAPVADRYTYGNPNAVRLANPERLA
jgi:hypothetical protein